MNASTVILKLRGFAELPKGWCYGEGIAPSAAVIGWGERLAIALLRSGFCELDAFPGLHGEVRVTAYTADDYVELTVETPTAVSVRYERHETVRYEHEDLPPAVALAQIKNTIAPQCSLSGSFINDTSIPAGGASKVSRSGPAHKTPGSQPLRPIVQWMFQAPFVPTSPGTTRMSAAIHQSSGNSIPEYCPRITC